MSEGSLFKRTLAALDRIDRDAGCIVVDGADPGRVLASRDVGPANWAVLVVLDPKTGR